MVVLEGCNIFETIDVTFFLKSYVRPEFKSTSFCWLVCEHFGTLTVITSRK